MKPKGPGQARGSPGTVTSTGSSNRGLAQWCPSPGPAIMTPAAAQPETGTARPGGVQVGGGAGDGPGPAVAHHRVSRTPGITVPVTSSANWGPLAINPTRAIF